MARSVTLGNGSLLVGFDNRGQVRDFYFPHVGHSNQVSGASGSFVHRMGVFVDGRIAWLDDPSWEVTVGCKDSMVVGSLQAVNTTLGVSLSSTDVVHNEENVLIRSLVLKNLAEEERELKLFISQQFRINESRRGDTGMFDPRVGAIIHYKGHVKLLVNAFHEGKQFSDYNIGLFGIEGKEGTFKDAEDGILEQNPIEHGSVDSVIGITCTLSGGASTTVKYWIACAETVDAVHQLNQHVILETPEALVKSTANYWEAWLNVDKQDLSLLSDPLATLYRRSLTTIRVHADHDGGIIASSDTDMLHHGRDTYSYVWPRDAAIIANAMNRSGHHDVARKYFSFITNRLEAGGYLMHKYRTDGVLGSSWHPWMHDGKLRLPIQEDETALTLYMLWQHYEQAQDIEFIESLYNPFIEPATNFMIEHMEARLGLPDSSFDLWEEKYGISTYTACSVYAALNASAHFANLLGKAEAARSSLAVAQRMHASILEHLYSDELGMFVKSVWLDDEGDIKIDRTVDFSSFFAPVFFGVLEPNDDRVTRSKETVERLLQVQGASKGYVRYEGDNYYRMNESSNPWVITTLWMAQFYIMKATTQEDLKPAYDILEWTCSHATTAGVLAEQMNPHTREHLSTAPLVWSHAEFVITIDEYLKKYHALAN